MYSERAFSHSGAELFPHPQDPFTARPAGLRRIGARGFRDTGGQFPGIEGAGLQVVETLLPDLFHRFGNPTTVATAILAGRQRKLHKRYQALASHYNFEPLFCMPARGNEKPHVENRVKNLQRRWATPVPQVKDLAELNVYLRECCQQDLTRTASRQSKTIG